MRELLRTNDPTLVAFVTALLSGEGIDCFPVDVHMSVLEGTLGVLPRRVLVRRVDYFRTCVVLTDNDIAVQG